ncbi:CDP-alcohol phosphatidyltransferase family protein [Gordonia sp. zg691]|uniref:CDP-alcohol phosphatidyltransferase family protein n=1 Tax=Gordonia jinghuaiqii TaxID=2758710 RepID=A0A7D7RUB0_9ACTN|nr:CDP-alcohol phosphatidyltransferase family protein [Gordonia jinghuaiqii]MCR5978155.1 CDP-alcohol phosphatidyltransferase family protein [Gordonia jinghuaiqii]QMT04073.1 CDP-alcohol phosphatidyltransferase family protein [Gordonia jinghuaiqii]
MPPRPHREAVLDAWSSLHGGIDPRGSVWTRNWVLLSNACARPLARIGITPNVVTVLGVVVTAVALCLTLLGGGWPAIGAVVIVFAALLDGIDGAIAAQTGTASRWGRVYDTLADRCSDLMLAAIVVIVGAPMWTGVTIAVLTLLLESTRATAQVIGMNGPGAVTVWERPSRVILAVIAALTAAIFWWAGLGTDTTTGLAAVTGTIGVALASVGTVQLLVAVRAHTFGGVTSPTR